MKKKYIILPLALLIYFVAMAALGIKRNHGHLPDDFVLICGVELAIIVALFFLLRTLDRRRGNR